MYRESFDRVLAALHQACLDVYGERLTALAMYGSVARGTLRAFLDGLRERLRTMGARRVPKGGGYYWELKPDYRWGDRIEL